MSDADPRAVVMLVDDEADILVALEDLLDDSYRLLTTTSPARALEMLAGEPDVAVIVSDQRMPEMPGNIFLSRARAISGAEALLLTGYADIEAVISAVNDGRIGGYAHKPWEPEALRGMIAAAAERYRLRRALAFEQAVFSALVGTSRDRVGILDAAGRLVRGDPTLIRAGEAAADRAAIDSGVAGDEEMREIGADGTGSYRRVQRIPFVADGAVHLLKIESDESARRLLEQRLQQSEKLQALGTLAGGIAHDFNNLLTAVMGNLELAAARVEDARVARYLHNAGEAARRGASLTKRLLSFSRQGEIATRTAEPNSLIMGMEDLIGRTTSGLVTIDYDLAREAWPVRVDPEQLELAILNLAINAKDAMPDGGAVRITTRNVTLEAGTAPLPAGDYVSIAVADQGLGMGGDVAARVFEPFFTTKERGRGTGLGLPMVHAMAINAGGRVDLATAPDQGTTVTLWLPRAGDAPEPPPSAAPPTQCRALRVLLVEDDADVRAVSEAYLRDLGHQVTAAASGEEALAVYGEGGGFDLVMTDFVMPGLNGAQIAEVIAIRTPAMPVLLVTGFADACALPTAISTLPKPFTREQLAAALAARCAGKALAEDAGTLAN